MFNFSYLVTFLVTRFHASYMTYAAGKKSNIIAGKIQSRTGVYLPGGLPGAGLFFTLPPPLAGQP
jgi:hypothetical protein